jgi:hypothetical protein
MRTGAVHPYPASSILVFREDEMTTIDEKEPLPPLPWTGGCQCGQVRYTLNEMPLTLYACHCTECQKQSSSAFGLSCRVRKAAVEVTGETASWQRPADSGRTLHARFCPQCGSRLFHERAGYAGDPAGATMNIKGGSLDIARLLEPVGHIWVRSKNAGTVIPVDAIVHEAQPEDYREMIDEWQRRHGR